MSKKTKSATLPRYFDKEDILSELPFFAYEKTNSIVTTIFQNESESEKEVLVTRKYHSNLGSFLEIIGFLKRTETGYSFTQIEEESDQNIERCISHEAIKKNFKVLETMDEKAFIEKYFVELI